MPGPARTLPKMHDHTAINAETTANDEGGAPNRRAKSILWDLDAVVPKWAPQPLGASKALPPATAVALELEVAKSMRRLRRRLRELWASHGMKAELRPLTLERWRWSAKWEEDQAAAASGKKAVALHPVLPSQPAPAADAELALELERQGLSAASAVAAVVALRTTSATQADALLRLSHSARSGKTLGAPAVTLHAHKHTVDLSVGRACVKLSWAAYGKLAILHRLHAPAAEASPAPTAAQLERAADGCAEAAEREAVREVMRGHAAGAQAEACSRRP